MKKVVTLAILAICLPVKASVYAGVKADSGEGTVLTVTDPEPSDLPGTMSISASEAITAGAPLSTYSQRKVTSEVTKEKIREMKVTNEAIQTASTSPIQQAALIDSSQVIEEVKGVSQRQDSLLNTPFEFLRVVTPNQRAFVKESNGKVYFYLAEGKLKDNVEALLGTTSVQKTIMSGISDNHVVPASIWISGDTVLEVLDAIFVSYDVPFPIYAEAFANRVVEVKYDIKK